MSAADALRVATLAAQAEMALVRRDPVSGPLLAQAARAAAGTAAGDALHEAASLMRQAPESEPVRQVALSLCRIGLQEAQSDVLRGAG